MTGGALSLGGLPVVTPEIRTTGTAERRRRGRGPLWAAQSETLSPCGTTVRATLVRFSGLR